MGTVADHENMAPFHEISGETDENSAVEWEQTCLPAGTYCDVISGDVSADQCTGKSIVVDTDGTALISLSSAESEGVVAFHIEVSPESDLEILVVPLV